MIAAAALCPSPPLLARELTGQSPALPELRDACATAVARLLAAAPDLVVVAGPADVTAAWPAGARLDLARYAPARYAPARYAPARYAPARYAPARYAPAGAIPGTPRASAPRDNSKKRMAPGHMASPPPSPSASPPPSPSASPLPLALGIGALLLDEAGYAGPRSLWSVAGTASPRECARLGRELSGVPAGAGQPGEYRVALLAMGDGSARRSASAPGYLDERAGSFDAEVERAVRDGDLAALAAIGPALAADLMAAGRPSWQLLAAALAAPGVRPRADILYSGAPLGVGYLVAAFT